jgi:protein-S-isoprenylcysteine O-methyltransferase Ste14
MEALASALMIWARITFGRRSYHAAANPTAGGLVATGPYRWLRHPIYSAVLYFVWAAALDHRTRDAFAAAGVVTVGVVFRMYAEETLLVRMYPEYAAYAARTARVIPFVV